MWLPELRNRLLFEAEVDANNTRRRSMAENMGPFERGGSNPYGKYFTGQSYLKMLTESGVPIGNVTFEPGCRNHWHIHHSEKNGGQILLCTHGNGWYQEWGQAAKKLKAGDVVVIPQGVKHWHGAAQDSWFVHLSVEIPGVNSHTEWLEEVSDAEYGKLPPARAAQEEK